MQIAHSDGGAVIFSTSPYFADGTPNNLVDEYNQMVASVAAQDSPYVSIDDVYSVLDPAGQYASTVDGIVARSADGVHITQAAVDDLIEPALNQNRQRGGRGVRRLLLNRDGHPRQLARRPIAHRIGGEGAAEPPRAGRAAASRGSLHGLIDGCGRCRRWAGRVAVVAMATALAATLLVLGADLGGGHAGFPRRGRRRRRRRPPTRRTA